MKLARIIVLFALAVVTPTAFAAYSLAPYQIFEAGSQADAVAIGDINGDGRNDVVLTTTWDGHADDANQFKVFVYFQKLDGTLDAPRIYNYLGSANETGLALADFDGDRRMEILVGHNDGITILDWGPVRGKMAMRSRLVRSNWMLAARDVVVVDVDRDGALDAVTQSWSSGANIYFGDGQGGIRRQARVATPATGWNALEAGDFNGDGYEDFVVRSNLLAYVYYNDGSDDLSAPLAINPNPDAIGTSGALEAGDFNADGRDDLIVTRDRYNLALFSQNTSGELQTPVVVPTLQYAQAVVGHDLDLDGRDDLIVELDGHAHDSVGIYMQEAEGLGPEVFVPSWLGVGEVSTQGLAAGDINGDACPDIAIAGDTTGLIVHLGSGCNAVADLVPSLGLTPTVVALRLDNFGAAAAAAPEATVTLSVLNGALSIGTPPAGCAVTSQASRTAQLLCTEEMLAAGASRTLLLPLTVTGGDRRNALRASVSANTTTVELRLDNNTASRVLHSVSSAVAGPTLSTSTRLRAGR